MLQVIKPHI